jgi:hypothetical protein
VPGPRVRDTEAVSKPRDIRVGTAGWSIRQASPFRFDSPGTHLQRYARHFRCAELNSSFYRPHRAATYASMQGVVVVIGAGQIGQAIARRVGVGKHIVLADRSDANAKLVRKSS